jgi:putative transposase
MLELLTSNPSESQEFELSLDEIARQGAKRLLAEALQQEVEEYVHRHRELRDESGNRLIVRNGKSKNRRVTLGSGTVEVQAPRVNDRRPEGKFTSKVLPPYMRRSPKVENLLPVLYLKGLSTKDFKTALTDILGEGAQGLSSSSISALKKSWEQEYEEWKKRPLRDEYVYLWADGVNVSVRLGENKKLCLLVIIGVAKTGEKHLLSVEPGYRESKESWKYVLNDLKERGLNSPLLAIGDGALGFWSAIREADGFQETKEQRCWVHKIANVLDKLPKRIQPRAKGILHDMMKSENKGDAEKEKTKFLEEFDAKYPKATECLTKDWDTLTAFFDFPAKHWQHIRTTNPIESSFATVKLRTRVTKGAGSPTAAATMAFKLLWEAQRSWRSIRGWQEIENLLNGVAYKNGVMVAEEKSSEAVVA